MRLLTSTILAIGMALAAMTASATPISGTFSFDVWQGDGGGTSGSPGVQALPTNPLAAGTVKDSFTYTGALDFAEGSSNNVLDFLNTGGGSISGSNGWIDTATLSNGGFGLTTLMKITGYTPNSIMGTIYHDDGISLYQGGSQVVDSSSPTVAIDSAYSLGTGAFTLWYVEANGLPANLTMDISKTVPEPATMALMALGLLGIGFSARRRFG